MICILVSVVIQYAKVVAHGPEWITKVAIAKRRVSFISMFLLFLAKARAQGGNRLRCLKIMGTCV